jgi:TolB-like protein
MAPSLQAQPAAFQKAMKAYEAYNYEEATALFSEVAHNSSVERTVRRKALQYLGQIYIGEDQRKKAREAIKQLVSMEPPPIKLNPNRQPPPLMEVYYQVRKQRRGSPKVRKEGPGLQTLAIMDFRNSSVDQRKRFASLSAGFPSMMVNYLNGTTDLKVIERQRVQWLLDELKLQRKADVVDQSTAVRAGKLLGATAVLFGNYIVFEDQMRVSARLVKVETGEILLARKVKGEPDEFFDLVKELSRDVTRAINVNMEEDTKTGSTTQLLDAQRAYSDGLTAMENGSWQLARKKFREALKHDPNYKLARQRLESLKTMLAASESSEKTGGSSESGEENSGSKER